MHAFRNTCMHLYMHVCIYTYMYAFIHACMHLYMHVCIYTCVYAFIQGCQNYLVEASGHLNKQTIVGAANMRPPPQEMFNGFERK